MNKPLYFDDCYLKEFDATIAAVDGVNVVLDKTAFYATGGGQPNDTGRLVCNGREFRVVDVKKSDAGIVHVVSEQGLKVGDRVRGVIDWERRYRLMRMHTAAHVLSAAVNKLTGALVGGKQLELDKSRIDFTIEQFDQNAIQQFADEANKIIANGAQVTTSIMAREDALKVPGMVRLATKLPPSVPELRIVKIEGVDEQACGGTHVKNITEIGKISVLKADNKGKGHRRMYYSLE